MWICYDCMISLPYLYELMIIIIIAMDSVRAHIYQSKMGNTLRKKNQIL